MTDFFDALESIAGTITAPDDEQNAEVARLANEQLKLEQEISELENRLALTKDLHRDISTKQLPDKLAEAGLSEIKLTNGAKITVKPFYEGNIKKDREEAAFSWLRNNGHGDIIKNEIKLAFGKKEDGRAQRLREYLQSHGMDFTQKESVHYQTMRAFIREQVEGGTLPQEAFDLLGVYVGQQATIKFN